MTEKIRNFSAIILAGGLSSRIGQDKGELLLNGKKVSLWTTEKVTSLFTDVIYATNYPKLVPSGFNLRIVTDKVPHLGPLGALATALPLAVNDYTFVVAYDLPFINPTLIKFLTKQAVGYEICAPLANGKLQPLFAVYSKACLVYINQQLAAGQRRLTELFKLAKVKLIKEEEVKKYDLKLLSFFNINSWADYEKAVSLAAKEKLKVK